MKNNSKIRGIIFVGGTVRSLHDGDYHYVGPHAVERCYGLDGKTGFQKKYFEESDEVRGFKNDEWYIIFPSVHYYLPDCIVEFVENSKRETKEKQ